MSDKFIEILNKEIKLLEEDVFRQATRPNPFQSIISIKPPTQGPGKPEWWEEELAVMDITN